MADVIDLTESLLGRTKKLLALRGDLPLRQIAESIDVPEDWLRSFSCGRIVEPGVTRVEKLHNYLSDYFAAKRFQQHRPEARPS